MKRSRLIAALLASFFALHLTVASGVARALQSGGMADMGMMQMAPDSAMNAMSDAGEPPSSDEEPYPDEGPCNIPGMPGSCPSVASCALAISSVHEEVASDVLPAPAAVLSSQLPHTRTSPPELPPPRA